MIILVLGKSVNLFIPQRGQLMNVYIHSHFLKEDLPRIQYANPKINVQVNKLVKIKEETWQPELVLDFCSSPFTSSLLTTNSLTHFSL
jgi:Mitochondrial ribosomal protein L51 / S25 / CI-B8 domain